jgi:hypothetical protein
MGQVYVSGFRLTSGKESVNKVIFDLLIRGGIGHVDRVLIPPSFIFKSCTKKIAVMRDPKA